VYPMYSRYSVDVVWRLLHNIEVEGEGGYGDREDRPEHYIMLSRRYCRTGTAVGEGLFVDQVTRALKRPEPAQEEAFCQVRIQFRSSHRLVASFVPVLCCCSVC